MHILFFKLYIYIGRGLGRDHQRRVSKRVFLGWSQGAHHRGRGRLVVAAAVVEGD